MMRLVVSAMALALASACSFSAVSCGTPAGPQAEATAPATLGGAPAEARGMGLVVLGDSLTSGYGLLAAQAYPARLEELFQGEGYHEVEVINAGITGDTTAGGLRRVEALLEPHVRILVVALGGNDALRGLSTAQTYENLARIVEIGIERDLAVVVAGMEAPPNLGEEYRAGFRDVFFRLAREYRDRIVSVPFLLENVAGQAALNQADGIHPNEKGAALVAEQLYPRLRTLVDQMGGGGL